MKRHFALGTIAVLIMNDTANAANLAVIVNPPTMLSVFVLIIAAACLVGSMQVMNQVRGGYLSRSWQMFFIGFALLAISQIANVATAMELVDLPVYFNPAVLVLMAALFAYGVFNARKTLS